MAHGFSDVADNLLNERLSQQQQLRQAEFDRNQAIRQAAFDQQTAIQQATLDFGNAVESAKAQTAVSGLRAKEGVEKARFDQEKLDFQRKQLAAKRAEAEQPPPAQITQQGDPMRTLSSSAGIMGSASSGPDIASMIQEAVSGGSAVQGQVHTDPATGRVFESSETPTTPLPKVNVGLWLLEQLGVGPGATRTVLNERPDIQMAQERLGLEREQSEREAQRFQQEQQRFKLDQRQQSLQNIETLHKEYPSMSPGEVMAIENARQSGDLASANTILSKHESSTEKINRANLANLWQANRKGRFELEQAELERDQAAAIAQTQARYRLVGVNVNPTTKGMSDAELAQAWSDLTMGEEGVTDPGAVGSLHMLQNETLYRTGTFSFFSDQDDSWFNWGSGDKTKGRVNNVPEGVVMQLMDVANSGDPQAEAQAREALTMVSGVQWVQRGENSWDMDLSNPEAIKDPNSHLWLVMRNMYGLRQQLEQKGGAPVPPPPSDENRAATLTAGSATETPQGPRNAREAGENLGRNIRKAVDPTDRLKRLNAETKASQERAKAETRRRTEEWMKLGRGTKAAARGTGEFIGGVGTGLTE